MANTRRVSLVVTVPSECRRRYDVTYVVMLPECKRMKMQFSVWFEKQKYTSDVQMFFSFEVSMYFTTADVSRTPTVDGAHR